MFRKTALLSIVGALAFASSAPARSPYLLPSELEVGTRDQVSVQTSYTGQPVSSDDADILTVRLPRAGVYAVMLDFGE